MVSPIPFGIRNSLSGTRKHPFGKQKKSWATRLVFAVKAMTLGLVIAPSLVKADDWPQWQGPNRDAISREKGLLQVWPASGPSLSWQIKGLGGGDSAPAISKGRIFGMSNRDGKELVWALSETDGKEVWTSPLGDAVQQRMPQSKEGPGGTPTVENDQLYVVGMGGTVACLSVENGKLLWQRSLTKDFGGVPPMWSYRESPLVDGDLLICTPGGPEALVVALNKKTGETVWKSRLPGAPASAGNARPERPGAPNRPTPPNATPGNRGGAAPTVSGTREPGLFVGEHWGMTAFSQKIPNGNYLVKLYFAESFQGITRPGQRVFSFNVQGKEFKDFDIWAKAEGFRKAYIESVPVTVSDGELRITFTRQVENPLVNAIEIIPQPNDAKDAKDAKTIRIKAGHSRPFKDSAGKEWLADQGFEGGQLNPGTANFAFGGGGGRPGGFGGPRSGAGYASIIPITVEGQRQYVQLTAESLVGLSASDGKLLWRYDHPANRMGINCSTPIFQDGLIFAASAYGNGGGAAKLTKGPNGEFKAEEVYFSTSMQNHHGGMVVLDGALYGANGGNEGGSMACLDFQTGKVLWKDRKGPKGALVMADNRIYLRAESGTIVLIEPSREKLIERGRFEQPDRTEVPAWAHPVVANGKLYIRDQDTLFCYDIKAK